MTPLTDYLKRLATDPSAMTSFQADPGAAMTAAGIPDSLQAIIKSRDPAAISAAAIAEHPLQPNASSGVTWTIYIVIHF